MKEALDPKVKAGIEWAPCRPSRAPRRKVPSAAEEGHGVDERSSLMEVTCPDTHSGNRGRM